MKASNLLLKTLRDIPSDAENISHRLLLRAGYVQQVAAGIFSLLPIGNRSISKIREIIRDEMNLSGCAEVNMPVIQPKELWEESGRAETFFPPLANFKDKRERTLVIAPTHEETATAMIRSFVSSYRDLPVTIYQIQTKFRDETRPRGGLLRVREFEMKDAYSFDVDEKGLDKSFETMLKTYKRIFSKCGLEIVIVDADSGGIGGKESKEFVLIADSGDDTILISPDESYAANLEKAEFIKTDYSEDKILVKEIIETKNINTIEKLSDFCKIPKNKIAKSVIYNSDGEIIIAVIRADYDVNETKLRNILGSKDLRIASSEEVINAGFIPGYASPINRTSIKSVIDDSIEIGSNYTAGANKEHFHFKNVNYPRDFRSEIVGDIAEAKEGFQSPNNSGKLIAKKGIEVGHVFKLGYTYSEIMGANFTDKTGETRPILMGCYGIGIGRLLAAAIEANHDENGINLPASISPFTVNLIGINLEEKEVNDKCEKIYDLLSKNHIDVLFDDRDLPPGVKFKDSDLVGFPIRIIISKKNFQETNIEIKSRKDSNSSYISESKLVDFINNLIQ
ncbi:MAG: proline--tRNA ligase [Chloroflexi bacterium]|nr:proline--tRNA ligase [Chloroflexota bacterium]|tara:strand:- start:13263 stop:14957 length:1695 start_codon:yes stop_codon:yes gene_type:complete